MSSTPGRVVAKAKRKGKGKKLKKAKVKVVLRVRPQLGKEELSEAPCVEVTGNGVSIPNPREAPDGSIIEEKLGFEFDRCCLPDVTQEQLFGDEIGTFIDAALAGGNASVFAYGPTGAGKTHTMQGYAGDEGIIPRAVDSILAAFGAEKEAGTFNAHELSMSYLEIYNEKVLDLLEPKENDLPIRATPDGSIFIPDLAVVSVTEPQQFRDVFDAALAERTVGATALNSRSSRSHAVLIIKIAKVDAESGKKVHGKLSLVDLAGSEDNRRTANSGVRLKESGAINTSLFVLGKVVDALNAKQMRVPYRDSKLTRMLQDSLGGNSMACMIVNVAPIRKYIHETCTALSFGSKSRNIINVMKAPRPISTSPTGGGRRAPASNYQRPQKRVRSASTEPSTSTSPPKRVRAATAPEAKRTRKTKKASGGGGGGGGSARVAASRKVKVPQRTAESEAQMEQRLLLKLQAQMQSQFDQLQQLQSALNSNPEALSATAPSSTLDVAATPPKVLPVPAASASQQHREVAMTPASKMQVAKAMIMQAKAYHKHNKEAALDCYEKARKLLPPKPKLNAIIDDLREEIAVDNSLDVAGDDSENDGGGGSGGTEGDEAGASNVDEDGDENFVDAVEEQNDEADDADDAAVDGREVLGALVGGGSIKSVPASKRKVGRANGKGRRGKAAKKKASGAEDENEENEENEDPGNGGKGGDDEPKQMSAMETLFNNALMNPAVQQAIEASIIAALNAGGVKELMALKGVGVKTAEKIIQYRESQGDFSDISDLKQCGLGEKGVQKLLQTQISA